MSPLQSALEAYAAKFDNLDELMHPEIMADHRFPDFLLQAVAAGKPLTSADAEALFGPIDWDW